VSWNGAATQSAKKLERLTLYVNTVEQKLLPYMATGPTVPTDVPDSVEQTAVGIIVE
jgi:hypothetical protein